jgi:predicted nucleotidyltransferase component of viral defense system
VIRKEDIRDRAAEWGLRDAVVEKDYVLGWLLAAVGSHPATRDVWVFKGGTSIKKCFVETYRFSEDLDFTLVPAAPYDESALRAALQGVASLAQDVSGIRFGDVELRAQKNKQGDLTYEARLTYRGPLAIPVEPKVRFDLTRFEEIVLPSVRRPILHAYPDALPDGATVACYAFEELLAEKTRALVQRTRPRDLYDVALILGNHATRLDLSRTRDVLARKCAAKGVAMPTASELLALVRRDEELAAEWTNMLAHQLPALPELSALLERFEGLLTWLEPMRVRERPALQPATFGRSPPPPLVGPRGVQYWRAGVPLETIRFAGANRLMIRFHYNGIPRLAEPYSLRRPATGNLLLYALERGSTHIKAFNVAKIRNLEISNQSFTPQYLVEFFA